jgi:hypothetical protein
MNTEFSIVMPDGDIELELVVDGTIREKNTNKIAGTYKLLSRGGYKIELLDEYKCMGRQRATPTKNKK